MSGTKESRNVTRARLARAAKAEKSASDQTLRLTNKKVSIEAKIEGFHKLLAEGKTLLLGLDAELAECQREALGVDKVNATLQDQLEASVAEDAKRHELLSNMKNRVVELEELKDAFHKEVASLRSRAKDAVGTSERLSRELQRDHFKQLAQKQVLESRVEQMNELQLELASAKTTILQQSEVYEQTGTALERCKNNQIMEIEEAKIARIRLRLVRNEGATLKSTLEDTEKDLFSASNCHQQLETERAVITAELDQLGCVLQSQEAALSQMSATIGEKQRELGEKSDRLRRDESEVENCVASVQRLEQHQERMHMDLKDAIFRRDRLREHQASLGHVYGVAVEEERRLTSLLTVVGTAMSSISDTFEDVGPLQQRIILTPAIGGLDELAQLQTRLDKAVTELQDLQSQNAKLLAKLGSNQNREFESVNNADRRVVNYLSGRDRSKDEIKAEIISMRQKLQDLQRDTKVAEPKESTSRRASSSSRIKHSFAATKAAGTQMATLANREMALIAELDVQD